MKKVNLRHARTERQASVMKRIKKDGVCPFCRDFCGKEKPIYHTKPIIRKTKWWALTENFEPYQGAKVHLLLVYRLGHSNMLETLSPKAWADLGKMVQWAVKKYKLPAGAFIFRFGTTDYTGGSVSHLHAQIIFGGAKKGDPLRVKLGYVKAK